MSWIDKIFGIKRGIPPMENIPAPPRERKSYVPAIEAGSNSIISSPWYPVRLKRFDGEKTEGELGAPMYLVPDHNALRLRAYEAETTSDVVKMITGKYFKWVIGSGLKLQAEPSEIVLNSLGVNRDFVPLRALLDAKFNLYATMKESDYSLMDNLHRKAVEAFKTAFLSGDCVVVFRLDKATKLLNVQVIDGEDVVSPLPTDQFWKDAKERGNRIVYGVEIDARGTHVAYFIRKENTSYTLEVERIECQKNGRTYAKMMYGIKIRPNDVRGIPTISSILEKVDKLDRYTEASVGAAEERAKIVFSIKHNRYSNGENPILANIQKQFGTEDGQDAYDLGEALSKRITATTAKQTFNLPVGAQLESLASDQESKYNDFFIAIFNQICSAMDVPPEIALQKYDSNYSASRAAINGWGYIITIFRKILAEDFYKPFYRLWFEIEVASGRIDCPEFLKALHQQDAIMVAAFTQCKFTGVNMPHIDPLKEVNAVRRMLGDKTKGEAPLVSYDQATEALGQGDWSENYKKFEEESKVIDQNLITIPENANSDENTNGADS